MAQPEQELTFGERAVGLTFNPSQDPIVADIKRACANLIDDLDVLRAASQDGEMKRMFSVAITDIQSGQMWAVKAATWGKK